MTPKTATPSHVRALNQRAILEAFSARESFSKAELARQLGLSKPAMAMNVAELLEQGVLEELGEGECAENGGRKPLLLRFKRDHKYIVAIDFYYQDSIFVLSNLMGDVVNRFSIRQSPHQNFEAWVQMALNAISTLLSAQNIGSNDLAAIGISSPGVISKSGVLTNSRQYGAFDANILYRRLTENYTCPVYLKNSTNAAAIGEWADGAGKGSRNLVYLSCGQGLGAGFILDGQLYEGSRAAAGEIADFISPSTLSQGRSLEQRICIDALLERIRREAPPETMERFGGEVSFDSLVRVWENGDPFVVRLIDELAIELGCLISNLIMTFNCDLAVLGGEYIVFQSQLLPHIEIIVQQHCIIPAPVQASLLGQGASIRGMTTVCRKLYFDRISGLESEE